MAKEIHKIILGKLMKSREKSSKGIPGEINDKCRKESWLQALMEFLEESLKESPNPSREKYLKETR